jgi:hypothetical protein
MNFPAQKKMHPYSFMGKIITFDVAKRAMGVSASADSSVSYCTFNLNLIVKLKL